MPKNAMDRLACVEIAAFPLQLLLKRQPKWSACPAAVVAEDKPQGLIVWVNEKARQAGVLPGLRYAAAFSLTPDLRAAPVSWGEIDKAVAGLTKQLMRFSPNVEADASEPGVFWLDGSGLNRLYPKIKKWAHAIHSAIAAQGFNARVAVGFTRFGTYAAAKSGGGIQIFSDATEEQNALKEVPLDRLDIEPDFRDALLKLGIKTVGGLLSLPPAGLRERFGLKAHRLYRMAAGDLWAPLCPVKPEEPLRQKCILDHAETDATRLLFIVKQLLHPMLSALAARSEALAGLELAFLIERQGWIRERIRPAAPTLDLTQIIDLIRLRLESIALSAGVIEIMLIAEACPATSEQLLLFAERPARDLDAANRALARLRAEFGEEAVARAKLTDGHLPEARFTWEPLDGVKLPRNDLNGANGKKMLVRRIRGKPLQLSSAPRQTHEDGWLLLGPKYGSVDKLIGPYVVSGGWWNREIRRDYYFAETRRGDLLWIYYDRVRRRWFLQGMIE
ncbi:MAG TPA: DNA polymerase Y family protein [Candidatus Eisenbacteria bacterium]|nr:DNA polymerase Y family protein [Candidatus Eisenbacteria bacterium]